MADKCKQVRIFIGVGRGVQCKLSSLVHAHSRSELSKLRSFGGHKVKFPLFNIGGSEAPLGLAKRPWQNSLPGSATPSPVASDGGVAPPTTRADGVQPEDPRWVSAAVPEGSGRAVPVVPLFCASCVSLPELSGLGATPFPPPSVLRGGPAHAGGVRPPRPLQDLRAGNAVTKGATRGCRPGCKPGLPEGPPTVLASRPIGLQLAPGWEVEARRRLTRIPAVRTCGLKPRSTGAEGLLRASALTQGPRS